MAVWALWFSLKLQVNVFLPTLNFSFLNIVTLDSTTVESRRRMGKDQIILSPVIDCKHRISAVAKKPSGALGAVCVVIESEFLLLKAGQTRFVLPFQPAPYQTVFVIVFVCYWTDTVCPPGPFLVTTLVNSIFSSSFIIESRKPNVCPPHLFLHTN